MEMIISLTIIAVIFAVILPQFRVMENSWASKRATADAIQNGRILTSYLNQNLAKSARITAISDPCDTTGYIEFEGNDSITYRCEIGADNIVEFGPVGNLVDLAGPVSQLQFTCYDAHDLDTPITTPEDIRCVKVQTTLTNAGPGQDQTYTASAYLRTNATVSGLVGYWKLDEASGLTATDSSVSGNHGTLTNMAGDEWTNGVQGGAMEFGASDNDDYILVNDNSAINDLDNLTLSAWVYVNNHTDYGRFFQKWPYFLFHLGDSDDQNMVFVARGWGGQAFENRGFWRTDNGTIQTGQWYHVAVTYDYSSTANDPVFYIDGVSVNVNETETPVGARSSDTADLCIGNQLSGFSQRLDGILDDMRIYNRELTSDEIAQIAGTRAGLVGYWEFDETSGSTAYDSSGNNIDASVFGGNWESGGQIDGALDFDGTDDYVDTTIASNAISDLTFCMWFQSDDAGSIGDDEVAQRFITQMRTSTTSRLALGINNNRLAVYWHDGSSNVEQTGGPNLSVGQWYHAVVTYDGSDVRLYLDGSEKDSFSESSMSSSSTSTNIQIGRERDGLRYFDGLLDDVRVYRRALTEVEIQAIYNQSEYCCGLTDEILP